MRLGMKVSGTEAEGMSGTEDEGMPGTEAEGWPQNEAQEKMQKLSCLHVLQLCVCMKPT